LGDAQGKSAIAISGENIGWNTIVPRFMKEDDISEIQNVEMTTLDFYLRKNNLMKISLIKIDVEGYEYSVLKGFAPWLSAHPECRPPIICEVCPQGCELMGTSTKNFEAFMADLGYNPFEIDGRRRIKLENLTHTTDIVFRA
jgi:hypothetical protein